MDIEVEKAKITLKRIEQCIKDFEALTKGWKELKIYKIEE